MYVGPVMGDDAEGAPEDTAFEGVLDTGAGFVNVAATDEAPIFALHKVCMRGRLRFTLHLRVQNCRA